MDSAGQTDHPSNSLTTVTSTTTTSISLSTTDQTQNVSSLALPFGTDHSQPLTIQTSQQAVSVHPVISPNGKATMQTEQITWQQLMTLVGPSLVDAKQQGQQQQLFDGQPVTIMNLDNESGLAHPPLVPKSQEQQQSATTLTPELIIAGNTCQLQPQKQTPIILASAPAAQPQQIYFPENSNLANCQVVCGSAPQQIDTLQGGAVQNFNGLNTGGGQQLLILLTPNTVATTSNFVQQHQFQSDPYDTSKWQLIPLEMAPASATGTSQIITTSFTSPTSVSRVVMPSTSGNKQVQIGKNAVKRRQKRVACSCPICKENEGLPKQEKKKKHMCHLPGCSKTYVAVSHLRAHLRWHADDRPFECDHPACTQSFIRSDTLRRHKRIHSACPRGNPAYTPGGTAKGPVVTRCSSNSPCANSQFHCVEGITEYGICCATKGGVASNTLEGSPDPGDVSYETKNVSRYYYASGQCLPFVYFGIGGNFNNFHTEDECRQFCSPKECTVGDPCWTHLAMRSGAQLGALPNTLVSPASAVHQQILYAVGLRSLEDAPILLNVGGPTH